MDPCAHSCFLRAFPKSRQKPSRHDEIANQQGLGLRVYRENNEGYRASTKLSYRMRKPQLHADY